MLFKSIYWLIFWLVSALGSQSFKVILKIKSTQKGIIQNLHNSCTKSYTSRREKEPEIQSKYEIIGKNA